MKGQDGICQAQCNLREQMVGDVGSNDTVEQVAVNETKVTVDSGDGTLDKGPAVGLVVVHLLVGVVKVGDGDEPVVNPHVGNGVEEEHGAGADLGGAPVDGGGNDGQANVRDGDVEGLAGAEDGRGGLKVALAEPRGTLVLQRLLAAGGIEKQVSLPAEELVADEASKLEDGGILKDLEVDAEAGQQAGAGLAVGSLGGHKGHVLLHVAGEVVVAVVRELPAEVRYQQSRVGGPAKNVVNARVLAESTVAALVGQNPETGAKETLNKAVSGPGGPAQSRIRNLGNVGQGGPAESGDEGHISHQVTN